VLKILQTKRKKNGCGEILGEWEKKGVPEKNARGVGKFVTKFAVKSGGGQEVARPKGGRGRKPQTLWKEVNYQSGKKNRKKSWGEKKMGF